MTDIEKTIKGLEVCREMNNPPGYRFETCADCPYHENGCAKKLKEDAIELLKEYRKESIQCSAHVADALTEQ